MNAIGQIFGCPKCGSMVLVEAPEGYESIAEAEVDASDRSAVATATQPETVGARTSDWATPPATAARVTWLTASIGTLAVVLVGVSSTFAWQHWKASTPAAARAESLIAQTGPETPIAASLEPDQSDRPKDTDEPEIEPTDDSPISDSESVEAQNDLVELGATPERQPEIGVGAPITDDVKVSEVFAAASSNQESTESEANDAVGPNGQPQADQDQQRTRPQGTLLSDASLTPSLGGQFDAGDTLANLASLLGSTNPNSNPFDEELEPSDEADPEALEPDDEPAEHRPSPSTTLANVHGGPEAETPSHARPELVSQKLEKKLLAVRFERVRLLDFVRSMMDLSGVPVQIEPTAIHRSAAKLSSTVSVAAIDKSAMDIMRTALLPLKLVPIVDGNVVKITTPASHATNTIQHSFDVEDQGKSDLDIVALVRDFVEPDSWSTGRKVELRGEKLTVTNSRNVMFDTLILVEKLRSARGYEPRSKLPAYRTSTSSRWSQANRYLKRPISVSMWHAQRWPDVISELETASGLRILVDWEALTQLGVTPNTETSLRVRDQAAASVFSGFFEAFDLVVVPLGGKTVQLTSRRRMLKSSYVELYPIAKLSKESKILLDELVENGQAVLDSLSGHAVVSANSEIHRNLAD